MKGFMSFFEGMYNALRRIIATTQWVRVLGITVATSVAGLTIFLGAAMLFKEEGAFTVGIVDDEALIALSETPDFANPTVGLSAQGVDNMTNISINWLPEGLDEIDGSHNGEHYIAYTFYLKNVGKKACDVREVMRLEASVKGVDEAIRVRLYKNGEETVYAKMGADGNPEDGTVAFAGDGVVYETFTSDLEADAIIKYTLVIWLEGDDPECLDNIKGGSVRLSLLLEGGRFEAVPPEEVESSA